MPKKFSQIIFQRQFEPNENGASILVPQGWHLEGGCFRANFNSQMVTAQNIEAKFDLSIKKDAQGTVMLRSVPEMKYCDPRYLVFGYYPPGSSYMGLIVQPLPSPAQFLAQMMFPWAHPQAAQAEMVEAKPWEEYIEKFRQGAAQHGLNFAYDGAEVTFRYTENGVRYKEKAFAVLENLGAPAMGQWQNKATHYYRAPEDEFEDWEGVLFRISRSWQYNPQWQAQELASQQALTGAFRQGVAAERQRAQNALNTQRYIQDGLADMLEHKRVTQEEIRNDNYLTMTNQEEYVNPYTNLVDTGSNQYGYRWVTERGDEFYTDSESDNPNDAGGVLERNDWRRTPVRPRRPYNE